MSSTEADNTLDCVLFKHGVIMHIFKVQLNLYAPCVLYIYRTDIPLLPTWAPCILYIGQTYRSSPHRHHASCIQDRRTATPHMGTMHPIYRTDKPLLPTQAPCILYIGQTYCYSPEYSFYIFSQQIYLIFFTLSLTIFVYSPTKCRVFPNVHTSWFIKYSHFT